jgi:hypothetical protein
LKDRESQGPVRSTTFAIISSIEKSGRQRGEDFSASKDLSIG